MWDQLRSLARVVTIGYASNPHGIYDLGWGDVELLDDDGTINWLHWEPLNMADVTDTGSEGGQRHLQAVKSPNEGPRARGSRFDDTDSDDDLPMRPRTAAGEPQHEIKPPAEETGTDDDGPIDEPR